MIVWVDMHIRDERVFEYIKTNGNRQIKAAEIASVFHCHENTARSILRRLQAAGLLKVVEKKYRGGFIYEALK